MLVPPSRAVKTSNGPKSRAFVKHFFDVRMRAVYQETAAGGAPRRCVQRKPRWRISKGIARSDRARGRDAPSPTDTCPPYMDFGCTRGSRERTSGLRSATTSRPRPRLVSRARGRRPGARHCTAARARISRVCASRPMGAAWERGVGGIRCVRISARYCATKPIVAVDRCRGEGRRRSGPNGRWPRRAGSATNDGAAERFLFRDGDLEVFPEREPAPPERRLPARRSTPMHGIRACGDRGFREPFGGCDPGRRRVRVRGA